MPDEASHDARAFRDVCGRFATGVTVVTMHDGGQPHGFTVNAFASVSLDPSLLLVCIDKAASVYEAMERAGSFTVNILTEDQRELADFFASHGREEEGDTMGGFPYRSGKTGSPILEGTLGWIDCRFWRQSDAGDHTMVLGEVVDMELLRPDGAPLLFYAGGYRRLGGPA